MRGRTDGHRRAWGPRSLRGRLALLFAIGSAVLLLSSAGSLYVILNRQLGQAIDEGLRQRVTDIAADIDAGALVVRPEEPFAQLISASGTVLGSSATITSSRRVLGPTELHEALRQEFRVTRDVNGLGTNARLLARPHFVGGQEVVIVVGSSLETVSVGQRRLGLALAIASPILISAIAGGGWLLAGAALHPVGRMTEEAEVISLTEEGRRLPQPPGDDEIARLGRTLNAMLDRIEASFARERAFVDDASHELRTPLAILRGELELALLQTDDPREMERALRSSLEEAERLSRLADDLLVLARSQAGGIPLTRESLDILAASQNVTRRIGAGAGPAVVVKGEPVVAMVDAGRLDQILMNLIGNARRFANEQVIVEVHQADGVTEITVADDGPGFPSHLLPHAFDRFTRGDQARGRHGGGAGLGLAIVAALVQAHRGTVEANNGEPLGGACVRVRIPTGDVGPTSRRASIARSA
ncbi:MAG TPA: ATP-binding protein [Acidimicrobiales bacterium]|nr:ATP-binding protein [Acidimicrobiales bacterium]